LADRQFPLSKSAPLRISPITHRVGRTNNPRPLARIPTLIEVAAHVTGSGVRIATGADPDATSGTNKLLPGSGTWFFVVAPGWKLSAVSDDATAGTINITEAASLG
jgi:hypothetical protein